MTAAKLFFSYSHKNEALRNELEVHLSPLKRQGIISTWHDRRIGAGNEFDDNINKNLESADIILLLVSPHFIASDYCYEVEMKRALERHEKKEAIVIPVILEPCDWHHTPFGKILATPTDGKPITKFSNLNDGFLEVVKEIRSAAKRINPSQKQTVPDFVDHVKLKTSPSEFHPIRSSNLRIKKTFSDLDKDTFLTDAFDYIANYFEGSLSEFKNRNPEIATKYRRIDVNTFTAIIYKNGSEISRCTIWFRDKDSPMSGILYSTDSKGNGFNESLSVDDDGYSMYLKPLGMSFHFQGQKEQLSFEGGAEYYWSMFIQYLQ